MGNIKDFINEKYYMVTAGASIGVAGIVGAVASAGLGGIGMIIGAGVGVGTMVGAALFRPRSEEEIAALNANRRQLSLEEILKPVLEAGEVSVGDERNAMRTSKDLRKIQSILSTVNTRRATLGEFSSIIADMLEDTSKVAKKLEKINHNATALIHFDTLLYTNIPKTIDTFLSTSDASSNAEIRSSFKSQIDLLHRAVRDIDNSIRSTEMHDFEANGEYLNLSYGNMKPIEQ